VARRRILGGWPGRSATSATWPATRRIPHLHTLQRYGIIVRVTRSCARQRGRREKHHGPRGVTAFVNSRNVNISCGITRQRAAWRGGRHPLAATKCDRMASLPCGSKDLWHYLRVAGRRRLPLTSPLPQERCHLTLIKFSPQTWRHRVDESGAAHFPLCLPSQYYLALSPHMAACRLFCLICLACAHQRQGGVQSGLWAGGVTAAYQTALISMRGAAPPRLLRISFLVAEASKAARIW